MTALNRQRLRETLDREGIDPDAYSLYGGTWEDRYCLDQQSGGRWVVYFVERGARTEERVFDDEAAACQRLLELILADRTTREPREQ